jgi:hypothetical protein
VHDKIGVCGHLVSSGSASAAACVSENISTGIVVQSIVTTITPGVSIRARLTMGSHNLHIAPECGGICRMSLKLVECKPCIVITCCTDKADSCTLLNPDCIGVVDEMSWIELGRMR